MTKKIILVMLSIEFLMGDFVMTKGKSLVHKEETQKEETQKEETQKEETQNIQNSVVSKKYIINDTAYRMVRQYELHGAGSTGGQWLETNALSASLAERKIVSIPGGENSIIKRLDNPRKFKFILDGKSVKRVELMNLDMSTKIKNMELSASMSNFTVSSKKIRDITLAQLHHASGNNIPIVRIAYLGYPVYGHTNWIWAIVCKADRLDNEIKASYLPLCSIDEILSTKENKKSFTVGLKVFKKNNIFNITAYVNGHTKTEALEKVWQNVGKPYFKTGIYAPSNDGKDKTITLDINGLILKK